jgi:hypothetical protein
MVFRDWSRKALLPRIVNLRFLANQKRGRLMLSPMMKQSGQGPSIFSDQREALAAPLLRVNPGILCRVLRYELKFDERDLRDVFTRSVTAIGTMGPLTAAAHGWLGIH